jgi:hypothetical protein
MSAVAEHTETETLEQILAEWHQWQRGDGVARGYAPKALVCGDYRISRQYDSDNGALDDDLDDFRMRTVDFEVREMPEPWRSAVYVLARALTVGCMVIMSPRLPQDRAERERVMTQARAMIAKRLKAAGVM